MSANEPGSEDDLRTFQPDRGHCKCGDCTARPLDRVERQRVRLALAQRRWAEAEAWPHRDCRNRQYW